MKSLIVLSLIFTASLGHAESADWMEVKVKKNESLQDVSFRLYGTSRRWQEIYKNNTDQIKNPNWVSSGIVLKVAKPKDVAFAPAAEPAKAPEAEAQPRKPTAVPTVLPVKSKVSKEPTPVFKQAPPLVPFREMELPR